MTVEQLDELPAYKQPEWVTKIQEQWDCYARKFWTAHDAAREVLADNPGPWSDQDLETDIAEKAAVDARVARSVMVALVADKVIRVAPDRSLSVWDTAESIHP